MCSAAAASSRMPLYRSLTWPITWPNTRPRINPCNTPMRVATSRASSRVSIGCCTPCCLRIHAAGKAVARKARATKPTANARVSNIGSPLLMVSEQLQDVLDRPADHRAAAVDEDRTLDEDRMRVHRLQQFLVGAGGGGQAERLVFLLARAQQRADRQAEHAGQGAEFGDAGRCLEVSDGVGFDPVLGQQRQGAPGLGATGVVVVAAVHHTSVTLH